MSNLPRLVNNLEELDHYRVIFCDVWGVIHNGMVAHEAAGAALKQVRRKGKTVVLITNSPRLGPAVKAQLTQIGADAGCYDEIVTSGDVTRQLIADGPRRVFHLGPERDAGIYQGLDVELTSVDEAQALVCTGLFDDEAETPDDYADLLAGCAARGLPFVCANPDIVVERGPSMIWCAGALARAYEQLGGKTQIAGKPNHPIYAQALDKAVALRGADLAKSEILAIGDGAATDIKGARDFGIDSLFIAQGIHAGEYGGDGTLDTKAMTAFLAAQTLHPVAAMPVLR